MRITEEGNETGGVAQLEGSGQEVERGGAVEGGGGGRRATREEMGEVRMSVMAAAPRVLTRSHHHFLLVAVVVVVMVVVVASGPALASRPPSLRPRPLRSLPQHLPLISQLQRWPYLAAMGMRPRRVRSALAPPTVTSLRPPDRSLSGQRQAGRTGGVGSGGSSGSSGPPVVASQSPSSANTPSRHVYHDRHNRQGPMAPMATAASGSRSRGGEQSTSRQGTSGSRSERGEGIHILGQESSSSHDSRRQHHKATASGTGTAQGNSDSATWNGDLVIESHKTQKVDNESQSESGELLSGDRESEWQGGELSGNHRVLDWDSDNLQGGRKDEHGLARVEESVWREREGSPVMEQQWWRESGVGGGVLVEEGAGGGGRRRQSTPRNDTYGHAITEDLAHLSSGHARPWRPRGGRGGGGPLSPSLAGKRHNQATRNRNVWVLEEVKEEEEGEKEESKEVRMSLDKIPQVANADFVNAYLHAAQHYQESKREKQMQPRGVASSYPSSSSSPSSSHPSIFGSSYYPPSTSLSSSPPHSSSSSATYSSSSNLRDDVSPFHQSLAPQQPRPSSSQDDEYEPEDYTIYHEYDHHSRNTLPQDNTWHPRTSQGQQGNAARHWDQQQGDLGIRRPTNVNTRHNDFSFSDDEGEAGENGYPGEERVGPDFNVPGSSPSASPEREREDERERNVGAAEDSEEQNQRRRNRKKDRINKGKGRRDRERGRKNRRGRNKGGRRWRQGRKQSTTPIPFSPSSPTTTIDNEAQAPAPASTSLTPDAPLEPFLSTEIPVGTPQSSPQPVVNLSTQAPIHPQTGTTTFTTATLLPAAPSAVPTNPSRAVPSQTIVTTPQATTHILPQGSPRIPNGKTALVSEITVTVMETHTDEYDDITLIENLRPARRRPNLQENNNRGLREEDRQREGINNEDGSERDPVKTEVEVPTERTNFSREQQRDGYRFPVKGILIISGLMGALAVFTLVVLISYAVIKCSKKPVVNNYQVSEQKNEVPS